MTTETIALELEAARRRSLDLLAPLAEADLVRQHSRIMSPLVWDLAHVGNYEDLWLVRAMGGRAVAPEIDGIYDAFRHPRQERPNLPLLGPAQARSYLDRVRDRALALMDKTGPHDHPLCKGGFVWAMVAQHEHQHDETMLATLSLMGGDGYRPAGGLGGRPGPVLSPAGPSLAPGGQVLVAGGPFVMGTDDEPWALDNERPAHVVDLAPYWIDTAPVTNAAFLAFVEAGGYHEPRLWHPVGWAWRQREGVEHPLHWQRQGEASWARDRFGWVGPLDPDEPVQHVGWYEADAFARWAGRRLPTEAEWEKAASWDPTSGTKRRWPWGSEAPSPARANLSLTSGPGPAQGQPPWGPSPVNAHPAGASPWRCLAMVGDVWEWTASSFRPYPNFSAFPYREYSEVFWGDDYKVLRGGSWATHPVAIRATFRNWDYPIRRQIFTGFRCARDA